MEDLSKTPAGKIRVDRAEEKITRALVMSGDVDGTRPSQTGASAVALPGYSGTGSSEGTGAESAAPYSRVRLTERVGVPEVRPGTMASDQLEDVRQSGDGSPHPRDSGIHGDENAPDMDMDLVIDDDVTCFLIDQLGGSSKSYARDRKTAFRKVVSEVFSPPRVTAHLSRFPNKDLLPGFALDLTCVDPSDGLPWDFDKSEKRARALKMVREERPRFLIGSAACTAWCSWQALNDAKRDPDIVRREKIRSLVHLQFLATLCKEQMDNGSYFVHEHPE